MAAVAHEENAVALSFKTEEEDVDDGRPLKSKLRSAAQHATFSSVLIANPYGSLTPISLMPSDKNIDDTEFGSSYGMICSMLSGLMFHCVVYVIAIIGNAVIESAMPAALLLIMRFVFGGATDVESMSSWIMIYAFITGVLWGIEHAIGEYISERWVHRAQHQIMIHSNGLTHGSIHDLLGHKMRQTRSVVFSHWPSALKSFCAVLISLGLIFSKSLVVGLIALGALGLICGLGFIDIRFTKSELKRLHQEASTLERVAETGVGAGSNADEIMRNGIASLHRVKKQEARGSLLHIVSNVVKMMAACCSIALIFFSGALQVRQEGLVAWDYALVLLYFIWALYSAVSVGDNFRLIEVSRGGPIGLALFDRSKSGAVFSQPGWKAKYAQLKNEASKVADGAAPKHHRMWTLLIMGMALLVTAGGVALLAYLAANSTGLLTCANLEITCSASGAGTGKSLAVLRPKQTFDLQYGCILEQTPAAVIQACACALSPDTTEPDPDDEEPATGMKTNSTTASTLPEGTHPFVTIHATFTGWRKQEESYTSTIAYKTFTGIISSCIARDKAAIAAGRQLADLNYDRARYGFDDIDVKHIYAARHPRKMLAFGEGTNRGPYPTGSKCTDIGSNQDCTAGRIVHESFELTVGVSSKRYADSKTAHVAVEIHGTAVGPDGTTKETSAGVYPVIGPDGESGWPKNTKREVLLVRGATAGTNYNEDNDVGNIEFIRLFTTSTNGVHFNTIQMKRHRQTVDASGNIKDYDVETIEFEWGKNRMLACRKKRGCRRGAPYYCATDLVASVPAVSGVSPEEAEKERCNAAKAVQKAATPIATDLALAQGVRGALEFPFGKLWVHTTFRGPVRFEYVAHMDCGNEKRKHSFALVPRDNAALKKVLSASQIADTEPAADKVIAKDSGIQQWSTEAYEKQCMSNPVAEPLREMGVKAPWPFAAVETSLFDDEAWNKMSSKARNAAWSNACSTPVAFDRGHMIPANHFDDDKDVIASTNYMINILPQHGTFNRGAWYKTEKLVDCLRDLEKVTVVGGAVFGALDGDPPSLSTQLDFFKETHGVTTPSYNWKLLQADPKGVHAKDGGVIAFWFPNVPVATSAKTENYVVSVAQLEENLKKYAAQGYGQAETFTFQDPNYDKSQVPELWGDNDGYANGKKCDTSR